MNDLNLLQWPAMIASVVAAWLVGGRSQRRRKHGFWWFLASNVLWIGWAWPRQAWALVALQIALAALNFRGLKKNDTASSKHE
ncbi:MAG: hypothetical protein QM715_13015 [Nibricoccus sp.]